LCAQSTTPVNTVIDVIGGFSDPLRVVVSSNSKYVYVVEGTPIPVGNLPVGINITPDGKTVYTINATSVSAIDTNSNTVISTIDLSTLTTGTGAFAAVAPEGDYLYVAVTDKLDPSGAPGNLVLISTATNEVVGTPLVVGINPFAVAIAPNGKHAYITSTNFGVGEVTVIEIAR
jgi:large repetitive protein